MSHTYRIVQMPTGKYRVQRDDGLYAGETQAVGGCGGPEDGFMCWDGHASVHREWDDLHGAEDQLGRLTGPPQIIDGFVLAGPDWLP